MGLPPVSVLLQPSTCFPAWHVQFKKYGGRGLSVVKSGCSTSGGNVQCRPEDMAKKAGEKIGMPVSLEVYTLARYLASEVGSGTVEEKIAVAQAAVNRAVYVERLPHGILSLLLYRQKPGHPNYGHYGPIHGPEGVSTAPYGRWAATSKDPTAGDIIIAQAVLVDGTFDGFNKGADDQMGPEYLSDPYGSVEKHAKNHKYWVGPLPGVNPWRTFQYRTLKDVAPDSELGRFLIARGQQAMRSKKPSWTLTPICGQSKLRTTAPLIGLGLGAGLLGFLLIGIIGRHRQLLGGRPDDWWKRRGERDRGRLCYRTKTAALQAFRDANQPTIQAWGGLDVSSPPAEFDAINHKYNLTGRRAVKTIARALWVTAPSRPPFCLDEIDLETLNSTAPGQHGRGFILPNYVYAAKANSDEARHHATAQRDEAERRARRAIDQAFDTALYKRGLKPADDDAAPF